MKLAIGYLAICATIGVICTVAGLAYLVCAAIALAVRAIV